MKTLEQLLAEWQSGTLSANDAAASPPRGRYPVRRGATKPPPLTK